MREPITHDLKIHPEPFAQARAGRKRYEIRRDDRDFQVGDLVRLQEWDPARGYTGEELPPQAITCITRGYGLLDGYVVLGLGHGLPAFTPQLLDLQAEVKRRRQDAERWGAFIVALGAVLDVAETQDFLGAGYVEEDLLAAARRLAALAGPEASGRLRRALDLVQEAADSWLMGSGARAKDKAAEAAVELTTLIKGRG
jgi:hypothetical protein